MNSITRPSMSDGSQSTPEPVTRSWNKTALRVVLSFARGFGISIGLVFVVIAFYYFDERSNAKKADRTALPSARPWYKQFGPEAGVKVASHHVHGQPDRPIILGTVLNEGSDSWSRIQLEARFFDVAGKLVALCPGWSSGALRSGQEHYFSVNCGFSSGMPVPTYKSYQVEVVEAFYEARDGT